MEYYDNLVKHEQDDTYYIKGTASPRMVDDVVNGTDFHIVHSENKIAVSMIRVLPAVHEDTAQFPFPSSFRRLP